MLARQDFVKITPMIAARTNCFDIISTPFDITKLRIKMAPLIKTTCKNIRIWLIENLEYFFSKYFSKSCSQNIVMN